MQYQSTRSPDFSIMNPIFTQSQISKSGTDESKDSAGTFSFYGSKQTLNFVRHWLSTKVFMTLS
jgi:hypothetical protein